MNQTTVQECRAILATLDELIQLQDYNPLAYATYVVPIKSGLMVDHSLKVMRSAVYAQMIRATLFAASQAVWSEESRTSRNAYLEVQSAPGD